MSGRQEKKQPSGQVHQTLQQLTRGALHLRPSCLQHLGHLYATSVPCKALLSLDLR